MAKETVHKGNTTEVKRGNVIIRVREGKQRVKGKEYPQFWFDYSLDGQRVKRRYATLKKAKEEAGIVAAKIASAEHKVLQLTSSDRTAYLHAMQALKPLGKPLNVAVTDYVEALKSLPDGKSLREAVDFYRKRNPDSFPKRKVAEVSAEMLTAKETAGRSEIHIKDMRCRLSQFGKAFLNTNIGDITGLMIQKYIDSLPVSGRTKKNHLRHITSLFKFAVKRKYLSKDSLEELEAVEMPEQEHHDIQIFSPAELQEILDAARPEILPWICVAAFAGLRSAEIQRLDWKDINLAERFIEVTAAKAKTASRRTTPVVDTLYAWLQPLAQPSGRVTAFENMAKQINWLVRDINLNREKEGKTPDFKWKRNGLRHSFVSYRTAQVKDVAQVALEAGNTPQMVFKHYRQLVSPKEATAWFAVVPPSDENIIPFNKAQNS